MERFTEYLEKGVDALMYYIPRAVLALVLAWIGFKLIKQLMKMINRAFENTELSEEVISFLNSFISIALKVLLVFSLAGLVGIDTTGFIAVLAAAGFAVGMALQGSLGNFAAGIVILLFRPYKTGDWVEIKDKFGKVEEIQIFNTIVTTPGKKQLIIPNGEVINGIVTNFSTKGHIRLELQITMPYSESFPKVKKIIESELKTIPRVLKEPAPEIGIIAFDSHNVVVEIRPYVLPDDYWDVYFIVYEKVKAAFHDHGIKVAYSEGIEMGAIGA